MFQLSSYYSVSHNFYQQLSLNFIFYEYPFVMFYLSKMRIYRYVLKFKLLSIINKTSCIPETSTLNFLHLAYGYGFENDNTFIAI